MLAAYETSLWVMVGLPLAITFVAQASALLTVLIASKRTRDLEQEKFLKTQLRPVYATHVSAARQVSGAAHGVALSLHLDELKASNAQMMAGFVQALIGFVRAREEAELLAGEDYLKASRELSDNVVSIQDKIHKSAQHGILTVVDLARTDELISCLANSGRRELRQ